MKNRVAAFGHDAQGTIGTSTTINSTDMAGILMIGVKTLEKRTGELRQENNLLKETVETFKAENAELKAPPGSYRAQARGLRDQVVRNESILRTAEV